jgi:hypothetical protein
MPPIPPYNRSARTDIRIWGLFLVGMGFVWAGSVVDPQTNCNDAGECAPWLVPIAYWMGVAFALAGAAQLWANPRRGSRIDAATGDLLWWQGADSGRIHPSRITRIRIVHNDDSADALHVYDQSGDRLAFLDEEVVPWPADRWARRLIEHWPIIKLELE